MSHVLDQLTKVQPKAMINNSKNQFLQRSKALALYRTILRHTGRIADPQTKAESRKYARDEFERHRNVTDIVSSLPAIQ
jgi:hypothetical protein